MNRPFLIALAVALQSIACASDGEPNAERNPPVMSSLQGVASGPDDLEVDCPVEQRQAQVVDYDPDADTGDHTARAALQTHNESQDHEWPDADAFRVVDRTKEDTVFGYEEEGRLLAIVWVRELERSWLAVGHQVCKEIFESSG